MSELIKNQMFGVEIETAGISRYNAIQIIAKHFGTEGTIEHLNSYDSWTCRDTEGRTWRCMSDCSIEDPTGRSYQTIRGYQYKGYEVVTPLLRYEDIESLQNIIRELRAAGACANSSCGIHVHVDAEKQDGLSLRRLAKFFLARQDLIYDALGIGERKNRWCKPLSNSLVTAMRKEKVLSKDALERIWYSKANDNYRGSIDHSHYNDTRYHGLNLHSLFTGKGIEYRLFNGTMHAGKIKAYIQFCLALSAWAIESDEAIKFNKKVGLTPRQKENLFAAILRNRLGLVGPEFTTCRYWMLNKLHSSVIAEEQAA